MYSLCHSERPFVILSASEESVSSPPIFSSSPSPDMCAGNHRYTLCMASRLRTSPHFSRHVRRQSLFHAVFSTFPAHISTPKPTSALTNLDTRPEWHTPCALLGIHRFPRSFTPFQDNGTRFEVTDPSLRLVSAQDDRNTAPFRMAEGASASELALLSASHYLCIRDKTN